jgi:hypothetical protein
MASRIALLPVIVGWQLSSWHEQWSGTHEVTEHSPLPKPYELGALASFASALVMYDGVALTNGPDAGRQIIPDWAYTGFTYAYNTLEDILYGMTPEFGKAVEGCTPKDILGLRESLEPSNALTFGDQAANYFAWHCISASAGCPIAKQRPNGIYEYVRNLSSVEPILGTGWLLARSVLELERPKSLEVIDRIYGDVISGLKEIQLPLILATAISRIDQPDQLIDELNSLHQQFTKVRTRFSEFEVLLSDPTVRRSGRLVRKLHADLTKEIRRFTGAELSTPVLLEEVPSLASLKPASILLSTIRLMRRWTRPELRLLGRWTRECAFDTVGRLRKVFRTAGGDSDWQLAAAALQQHGSLAWYPGKRFSLGVRSSLEPGR